MVNMNKGSNTMEPGILAGSLVGRLLAYSVVELNHAIKWASSLRNRVSSRVGSSKLESLQLFTSL